MRTLWTFGDSFTFGHGCRPDGPLSEYYYEYKSNDDDLIWPEILSKKLNCDLVNLGKCGASNDYIFDTIIENYSQIKENDFVIVNKTFPQRFDVPNDIRNELHSIIAELSIKDKKWDTVFKNLNKSKDEIETIINFMYHFSGHSLYEKRQDKRYSFIKSSIKCDKYYECKTTEILLSKFEDITEHTKGKIIDGHLSFRGHKQLANYIYSKLYPENNIL